MELIELISKRYSTRAYLNTPVEDEKLMKVLEAGRLAPSACNIQPWHIIVLQEPSSIEKMRQVCRAAWILQAPVIIAVCIDNDKAWKRADGVSYAFVDAAIVMDHMILQAAELGLGTCWIGAFNAAEAASVFNLPGHIKPVAMTPLGYPDDTPREKVRKSINEIVHWEKF
ncbi:MAG: nitroreductase family protein [Spirochaetes bacterium]|nr:nitroreductase family protein [Spirochaetota bacterium]